MDLAQPALMSRTSKTTSQCIEEPKIIAPVSPQAVATEEVKQTEPECAPCTKTNHAKASGIYEGEDKDELCTICYTQELGVEHCTKLSCGHVFHTNCIVQLLQHKWATLRITFAFMSCPNCKHELEITEHTCSEVVEELEPLLAMKKEVEKQALENAEKQGLLQDERLSNESDAYFGKPQEYANHRCSFYQCYDCKKPYFGGLIDCEQEMANAEKKQTQKEDLLCQECLLKTIGAGQTKCEKHGTTQIDWKCQFCCSVALFCCFGTHYMCESCHDNYDEENMTLHDCNGIDCPLGIPHPPPHQDPRQGGVFPLGCGICRSEKMELLKNRDVQQVISAENQPKALIGYYNRIEYGDEYGEENEEDNEYGEEGEEDRQHHYQEDSDNDYGRENPEDY